MMSAPSSNRNSPQESSREASRTDLPAIRGGVGAEHERRGQEREGHDGGGGRDALGAAERSRGGAVDDGSGGAPSAEMGKGKEKKRVGFLSTPHPSDDYFSMPSGGSGTANSTPAGGPDTPGNRESINREELSAALEKILGPEQRRPPQLQPPPRPRPVLRKQAIQERQDPQTPPFDLADPPPHRSELEARDRADRLASALSSRRSSIDLEESRSLAYDDDPDERDEHEPHADADEEGRQPGEHSGLRLRRQAQRAAQELVRTHTRGKAHHLAMMNQQAAASTASLGNSGGLRSGQMTPVDPDLGYVPRPHKYRGGILASLLKLYNAEDAYAAKSSSGGGSVSSTPTNQTPVGSPPASAPGTPLLPPGTPSGEKPPAERPKSGLFGRRLNHHQRSASATTVAGLIGSSSAMFSAPGSSDISGKVKEQATEKLREVRTRSRSPGSGARRRKGRGRSSAAAKQARIEDEMRITVHIAEIISRHRYLVKLCRALMMYGAPTHRLEAYMAMSARVLGIEGQFLYLPGCMVVSFDDSSTHTTEVKIVRVAQGVDLGRLRDVHQIYKEVVHDRIGVEEATQRLDAVFARPPKYNNLVRVAMYGLASVTVAPFAFEGRFIDLPIAFALGALIGLLQLVLAPNNELFSNIFEISAAVVTSFLARAFGSIRGGHLFCFSALAQSSIALILPGYMVLCASLELQSHNIVSGSVRMVYAMIYSLFLGYGITIGSVLYGYIDRNAVSDVHCRDPLSNNKNWGLLFVPLFTLCLCVVNQAKWKQMPVMLGISLAGWSVNSYSSTYFRHNAQISNTLGAFCVGVLANLYSRLSRHVENFCLDLWELRIEPLLRRRSRYYRRRNRQRHARDASTSSSFPLRPYGRRRGSPRRGPPQTADLEAVVADHHPDDQEDTAYHPRYDNHDDNNNSSSSSHHPRRRRRGSNASDASDDDDIKATRDEEERAGTPPDAPRPRDMRRTRQVGYGLAAAAMLPAIFVQVPSGLAVSGSLLSGVTSANLITGNATEPQGSDSSTQSANLNGAAFNVLLNVIQIAIGIAVGLSLSALFVYPLGKRRSGLFSL